MARIDVLFIVFFALFAVRTGEIFSAARARLPAHLLTSPEQDVNHLTKLPTSAHEARFA